MLKINREEETQPYQKERSTMEREAMDSPRVASGPPPPAQYQVTPQELSDALRDLEAQKKQILLGSLPLEETLQQLNVALPAAEVWQVVESRRAQKAALRKKQPVAWRKVIPMVAIVALSLLSASLAAKLFAVSVLTMGQTTPDTPKRGVLMPTETDTALKAEQDALAKASKPVQVANDVYNRVIRYPDTHYPLFTQDFFLKSPTMRRLQDVKDGESFPMELGRLAILHRYIYGDRQNPPLEKRFLDGLYFETHPFVLSYSVVRYGDKWYIRGWVPARPNASGQLVLHNKPREHSFRSETKRGKDGVMHTTQVDDGPAKIQIQIPLPALEGGIVTETKPDGSVATGEWRKNAKGHFIPGIQDGFLLKQDADGAHCDMTVDLTKLDERTYAPWEK